MLKPLGYKTHVFDKNSTPAASSFFDFCGMGLVVGEKKKLMLFTGSLLSNLEPVELRIKAQGSFHTFLGSSVEHVFQLCKAVHAYKSSNDPEMLRIGLFIAQTCNPSYILKLRSQIVMSEKAKEEWNNISIELLSDLVVRKMEARRDIQLVIAMMASAAGIKIDEIEYEECNKHDPFYGIKQSFEKRLAKSADGTRYLSPDEYPELSEVQNKMGYILKHAVLGKRVPSMAGDKAKAINCLYISLISHYGSMYHVNPDNEDTMRAAKLRRIDSAETPESPKAAAAATDKLEEGEIPQTPDAADDDEEGEGTTKAPKKPKAAAADDDEEGESTPKTPEVTVKSVGRCLSYCA